MAGSVTDRITEMRKRVDASGRAPATPDQDPLLREIAEMRRTISKEDEALLAATTEDAIVPCGTCSACCHSPVEVRPEFGDDPSNYEIGIYHDRSAPNGLGLVTLRMRPDGSCYALKNGRCTIWEKRPSVCRAFDCRKLFAMHTKEERRALVALKYFKQAIMSAGRERLHTLAEAEALRAACKRIGYGKLALATMDRRRGVKLKGPLP